MTRVDARFWMRSGMLALAVAAVGCATDGYDADGARGASASSASALNGTLTGAGLSFPRKGWDVTEPGDAGATIDAATPPEPACAGPLAAAPRGIIPSSTWRRDPYLQSVDASSAVVVWRAEAGIAAKGCVAYSVAGGPRQHACAQPSEVGQYEVRLEGLEPSAHVVYQASTDDGRTSPEFDFFTAPARSVPVRFVAIADGHRNTTVLRRISQQALADGASFFVHVGDSVSEPTDAQFDGFFRGIQTLASRVAYWPVIGNHELRDWRYFDAIVAPGAGQDPVPETYYSVRWGSIWFAAVEVTDLYLEDLLQFEMPQQTWLKAQLEGPQAQGATWKFLFIHQPAFNMGWGGCSDKGEPSVANVLMPLATQYGITAVFSGHMHGYEHGVVNGVHVFVTGGAGGGLDDICRPPHGFPQPWFGEYVHHRLVVDAGCDRLVVEARDLDDDLIDRVEIAAPVQ